jgi:hypothetical protein
MPDGGEQVRLADARRPEQEQVRTLLDPAVALGQGGDVSLRDGRHRREVEARQTLVGRQHRLRTMAVDATCFPLVHLVLAQGGEEALGRPAFAIGLLGERRPEALDGRQAQFRQQQRQGRSVAGVHAVPSSSAS